MKKIITLFILCSLTGFSQEWITVNEPISGSNFLDLYFVDENNGWAVGTAGVIYHTSDGGESWAEQNSGTTNDITKVFFLDTNNGWAGTGNNQFGSTGGTILVTTDGGINWNEVSYGYVNPTVAFVYCDGIYFTDPLNGFIIAGKAKAIYILKTTDGGLSWAKKDSLISTGSANNRWYDIEFYDTNKGIIVGNKNNVQKYTTNGGETWTASTAISDPFFKDLRAVHWLSETNIIAIGEGNEFNGVPLPLYKSTDAGLTWIKKTQQTAPNKSFERARDAYFMNSLDGIAVGSNGFSLAFLYKTSDGGETWLPSSAPYGFSLRTVNGKNNTIYSLGSSNHILKSTDLGNTWSLVNIKPSGGFNKLFFFGSNGFVVNRNGDLFRSDDKGDTWSMVSSTGKWESFSSVFINENTGFSHKENRYILKTTDGGSTWKEVLGSLPFSSRSKSGGICFGDENTGYARMSIDAYEIHYIYKTTDQGETWNQISRFDTVDYISGDIGFMDANNGFIVGPGGWARYTSDGGSSWNIPVQNNVPAEYLKSDYEAAQVIDENTAWAVGFGKIMKTTDKGINWEYTNHNLTLTDSSFYTISFLNNEVGYVTCFNGSFIKTTDGGITWQLDNTYEGQYIFFGSGVNEDGELFLGSADGYIFKYKNPSVGVRDNYLSTEYALYQNYPNPFNPSTTISFRINKPGNVQIKIFDVLGNEVAVLTNKYHMAGEHQLHFNASALSSGVYYYSIKSGDFISSKKMCLIK